VPNPEQGPEEQGILGTWQTVSLEIPDFFEPVREAIDAFFSFLIQILNILIAILEILKVFASGLLDPIIALIEAIRDLIEALLNDLRQLGVYMHGDFYALMDGPDFQSLRGGYLAYERRMIARLQDTSDPNRPDISEFSTCIAVFAFVGADIRGINRIIQLIRALLALFRRKYPMRAMNQVSDVRATYGYDGATIFSFNKGFFRGFDFTKESVDENLFAPYNAVNLTWQMSPIPGAPFPDTPILPPAGFLVEFSTLEQPIKIVCERPIEGTLEEMELANQPPKVEIVDCKDEDGNEIRIRGGTDVLDIKGAVNWNDAVYGATGKRKPDAVRAYGLRNLSARSPIPLDQLRSGNTHYLQKTFYVGTAQNIFFPGKGFGATFLFKDMPFAAEWEFDDRPGFKGKIRRINDHRQPERLFVRVRAVTRAIKSKVGYQFEINDRTLRDRDGPVLTLKNSDQVDLHDAGPPSPVASILFPDASTQLYLRAVAEALAIMALARADIPVLLGKDGAFLDYPPQEGQVLPNTIVPLSWGLYEDRARRETKLEEVAQFLMVQVVGRRRVKKFFGRANASVPNFRRKLFVNCINLTNRFLTQNLPPLAARQLAVDRAEDLLNFRIFRLSTGGIIYSIDPSFSLAGAEGGSPLELLQEDAIDWGVAPNPESMGIADVIAQDRIVYDLRDNTVLPREPHFFFAARGDTNRGYGSFDAAPVVYDREGNSIRDVRFFRNLVPDSVYEGARDVLQIAVGPSTRLKERGWLAFRVFPQGIPALDRFFDQILALLRSIQAAIESIAETIRRYIEYLQSRLRELQAFLNRINALIQRLLRFFFAIQPAAGLIVVAPGTDGVTTALMGSQNKPVTPPPALTDSYGGGIVLFAGGIPNLALDVFRALFKGSD